MPELHEIATWLDEYLRVWEYPEESNGVIKGAEVRVRRLGLALEPSPDLVEMLRQGDVDALLLHRCRWLDASTLPPHTGVLAYHLPFDEHLTLGFNPLLAEALGTTGLEPLGTKRERTIGMLANAREVPFGDFEARVRREFGGVEEVMPGQAERVRRVAVVGAMTDALVREAAARGADLYLTGQLRVPGRAAAVETGIAVIATGHRRSEAWGIRALARLLRRRFLDLEIFMEDNG